MTTLVWIASSSASALHAAAALVLGEELADARVAASLASAAADLRRVLADEAIPAEPFLAHLVPLSAGIENNRELATLAVRKATGRPAPDRLVSRLAAVIAEIENAHRTELPSLTDELALRAAPLREQWDARGPGLLSEIGRLTDPALLVERADVVLLHPALGGAGVAHLPYNSARIEAVLTNPHPELPEVVRLGWLVAQLHLDLPRYSEVVPSGRVARLAGLSMVPPALAAAAHVELSRDNEPTLRLALTAWRLGEPDIAATAGTLATWWHTCQDSHVAWPVALAALDQMLSASDDA